MNSLKEKKAIFIRWIFSAIIFLSSCDYAQKQLPKLPDVEITSITEQTDYAPHKKVSGVIGKKIGFELLLPDNWNGKFVMSGGGGYAGFLTNLTLGYGALENGYATVSTDAGHQASPLDGSWALNDLEAIVNFGHLAIHRVAVNSKALIEGYYQKEIDKSYFVGCSRGGGQAMMEAQRYPEDFDGIVAGAPAFNWTGMAAQMTHNAMQMYPDPDNLDLPLLSPQDLELIERTYLEQCDALDGIKDGILNDPRDCVFDPEILLCKGEKTDNCLTAEQVKALKAIYQGPKDANGKQLYFGMPLGGMTDPSGWDSWLTGGLAAPKPEVSFQDGIKSDFDPPVSPNGQYSFGVGLMRYFIFNDPNWSYKNYQFENFEEKSKAIGNTLNATNPDLSEFRKNGGKLLIYHGWSDMALTAYDIINYYEKVLKFDPSSNKDVKLYMLPGVSHCALGPGPYVVNWLDEIDNWVSNNNEPHEINAYYVNEKGELDGSRPLCPYPEVSIYDGKGDTKDSKSFKCGNK